jgi:hypothetical protein
MNQHPDLDQWQTAKKAAFAIAANMEATISQLPDGKIKRIRWRGKTVDCATWFACYCYLRDWRIEQIEADKAATARKQAEERTRMPATAPTPAPKAIPLPQARTAPIVAQSKPPPVCAECRRPILMLPLSTASGQMHPSCAARVPRAKILA